MSEVPTIREELNRKTVDTLELFLGRRDRKEITALEVAAAVDGIYGVVSGLVDEDVTDIMASIKLETQDAPPTCRLFVSMTGAVAAIAVAGATTRIMFVPKWDSGWEREKSVDHSAERFPFKAARDTAERLAKHLVSIGYKELA